MASNRDSNFQGNQRVDLPHLKFIESALRGDLDVLAGNIMAGQVAQIIGGFKFATVAVGTAASAIELITAGSTMIHPLASASGSIFSVPADRANEILSATNPRVSGSFVSGTTNYIGIDLFREPDDTTTDTVQFLDTLTDTEVSKRVPIAKTLDYRIYISTQDFTATPGIAPLAIVVTSSTNTVDSITDARAMLFRLASGGTNPDTLNAYGWPDRTESGSSFDTGDKLLSSLKTWVDAAMTRLWEIGGGEHWYSPTADRNVRMIRTGSPIVSSGDWFAWDTTNVSWQGLKVLFDNSTGNVNEIKDQTTTSPGLTNMADGDCIYVDLDRTQNLTGGNALQAVKAQMSSLGTPTVPGSRFIFLWRYGSEVFSRDGQWKVNAALPPATTSAIGEVKLNQTPGSSSAPVVPAINANGEIDVTATVEGSTSHFAIDGTGANSASNHAGSGVRGTGGDSASGGAFNGGIGLEGDGGDTDFGTAGDGVRGTGGAATVGSGAAGKGAKLQGGAVSGAGQAGHGVDATGGANTTGPAGHGGLFQGGAATTGTPGYGVKSTGGASSTDDGAAGGHFTGGASGAGAWDYAGTGVVAVAGVNKGYAIEAITGNEASDAFTDYTGGAIKITKGSAHNTNNAVEYRAASGAGSLVNLVTHLGFPTAQVSKFYEGWFYPTNGVMDAAGPWSVADSGLGSISRTLTGPGTTYFGNYIVLGVTSGAFASHYGAVTTTRSLFPYPSIGSSQNYLQAEFHFRSNNAIDTSQDICVGFSTDFAAPASSVSSAMFVAGNGYAGATWWTYTRNSAGAGTAKDTGIAVSTGGTAPNQRLVIEFYGANTEAGGNTVKFYVNGILATTHTGTGGGTDRVPDNAMGAGYFLRSRTAGATTRTIGLGCVGIDWKNSDDIYR